MTNYGPATEKKISEVMAACSRYGASSIVALAGVPGTGKSLIASVAAQRLAGHELLVSETQFHPAYGYEDFVEGLRLVPNGGVEVRDGVFKAINGMALEDPRDAPYVLLVEELTRANVPLVLGELLTYVEHRERSFLLPYSGMPLRVAPNLVILATYNPADRTAIDIDAALLRRLRIIACPPDIGQLEEMLGRNGLREPTIRELQGLFTKCKARYPRDYEQLMPFGHGVFSEVRQESPDLFELWNDRLRHFLERPLVDPHPFTETIRKNYPWTDASYRSSDPASNQDS